MYMINLYALLNLTHEASSEQILGALHERTHEPKLQNAVQTWLLDPTARLEYDARLQADDPLFFSTGKATPKLYHPDYAGLLGVVFLPSACYLHALNWRKLGNFKKADHNLYMAVGFLVFMTFVILVAVRLGIQIPIAIGLIWVFVWYYGLGKEQVTFVQHDLDNQYTQKNWYEPILLTVIAMSIYGMAIMGLLVLCEALGAL